MGYDRDLTHRGADVSILLFRGGLPLDIIAAEDIELHPVINVIEYTPITSPNPLFAGYPLGLEVSVSGVKKGNKLVLEAISACAASLRSGQPMSLYSAAISYFDINTRKKDTVKVINATMLDVGPFRSGRMNDKQGESFRLRGVPAAGDGIGSAAPFQVTILSNNSGS